MPNKPPRLSDAQRQPPKILLGVLVLGNVVMGFAPMREGTLFWAWFQQCAKTFPWLLAEGMRVYQVGFMWLTSLLLIPALLTIVAVPFKWRDSSFRLSWVYYMGWFIALVLTFQMMNMRDKPKLPIAAEAVPIHVPAQ